MYHRTCPAAYDFVVLLSVGVDQSHDSGGSPWLAASVVFGVDAEAPDALSLNCACVVLLPAPAWRAVGGLRRRGRGGEELVRAAQRGAQLALCRAAVEADVEGPGKGAVGP